MVKQCLFLYSETAGAAGNSYQVYKAHKEKDKWAKVLVADIMSSEESDQENEDVITVTPLPWRSEKVNTFFHRLDSKVETVKSSQAKRQRKGRVESSEFSLRHKAVGIANKLPDWAIDRSNC